MVTQTNLYISELYRNCLQYGGGVEINSFINIINTYTDDDKHQHQSQINSHSPYYNINDVITTLNKEKTHSVYLAIIII